MDYNKINKIDTDGSGNIILQDVTGKNITVNYNDTAEIEKLIEKVNDQQVFELKKIIASQTQFNQQLFDIASNIQKLTDQKQIESQAKEVLQEVDEILREFTQKEIQGIKKQLFSLYELLRAYEDELMLTDDPKLKMKYQKEVKDLKAQIENEKQKLVKLNE